VEILNSKKELCANVIYITERIRANIIKTEVKNIHKVINFIISRENVARSDKLHEYFSSIITTIEEETKMIIEDNDSQGKYVNSVQSVASKYFEEGPWFFDDSSMKCEVSDFAVFEYWGDLSFNSEIISDTEKYPWMPISIAPDDIPF
jgi:GTPase Era involved in 16S rRNA processing